MKLAVLFTLVLLTVFPKSAEAQNRKATPENVSEAIKNCVSYLTNAQTKIGDRIGSWQGQQTYGTGQTSLVTLALLSAGKTPKSPEVSLALNFIRNRKPVKTYEAALKVMVLCAAEPAKDRERIQESVEWLCEAQLRNGGWSYDISGGGGDESNTQFATLALWEASKLGILCKEKKPEEVFSRCAKYWKECKQGDGWGYSGSNGPSASMTCAGIASTIILQDSTAGMDAMVTNERIQCCGNVQQSEDVSIDWLARNFSVTHNVGGPGFTLYYLYALERVGRLTGQRLIGTHDWYREGAEFLLQTQQLGGLFVTKTPRK